MTVSNFLHRHDDSGNTADGLGSGSAVGPGLVGEMAVRCAFPRHAALVCAERRLTVCLCFFVHALVPRSRPGSLAARIRGRIDMDVVSPSCRPFLDKKNREVSGSLPTYVDTSRHSSTRETVSPCCSYWAAELYRTFSKVRGGERSLDKVAVQNIHLVRVDFIKPGCALYSHPWSLFGSAVADNGQ